MLPVLLGLALVAAPTALLAPTTLLAQSTGELPITTSSSEARELLLQARDLVNNVERETAIPLLDRAIEKDPSFAMAFLYRFLAGGPFSVSRPKLDRAAALSEQVSPGERLFILGTVARVNGETALARERFAELARLFPSDPQVLYAQALALLADDEAARQKLERVTALDAGFAPAYNQLGYLEMRRERFEAAERAFLRYIALRHNAPNPYDSYAELLTKMGRYDASVAQYQKALEKDPYFFSAIRGIGHNYTFKGEFERARAEYRRLFDVASEVDWRTDALYWTAATWVHEGDVAKAVAAFDDMRVVANLAGQSLYVVNAELEAAHVLAERGLPLEAVPHLDKAAHLIASADLPAPVKTNLAFWEGRNRALMLMAQGRLDLAEAAAASLRADAESAGSPELKQVVHALAGRIALLSGNHRLAAAELQQAHPQDVSALYWRAVAIERSGNTAKALNLFAKVASWNVNSVDCALVRPLAIARVKTTT